MLKCVFLPYIFKIVKQFIYFFLLIFLFSCGNKSNDITINSQDKSTFSIVKEHDAFENINTSFEREVANWQELKMVDSFITKFQKVSPNEALSNALELRDLVKGLKDSVIPQNFEIPSFHARVNVLYNETLRLADLTLIPAITFEEVNLQVNKTIAAFSSVNSKINTLLSKKRFEDAIDIKFDYIGMDSTKIDSVSKKAIRIKEKKRLLKVKNSK